MIVVDDAVDVVGRRRWAPTVDDRRLDSFLPAQAVDESESEQNQQRQDRRQDH